ncbi:hypothetical protein H5410_064079 [Solanum commersonii]|uniref:Uncharacterized protein n=1 Tax=Solanum commersonii TaxID=4109 RepID=A0A9J5W0N8_SOLCO|nr:hypothetical protein H5410_064079 [Solanum commersonii]
MSVKTLPINLVSPHDEKNPFTWSNSHRSSPYLWSQLALTAKTTHYSDLIFANNFPGRPLRPYLWSQLALTAKTAHFQGQMIPGAGKPPILSIFIRPLKPYLWSQLSLTAKRPILKVKRIPGVVHGFFRDPEFRPHNFQNFTWTSVKTLPMEPVVPHGQNGPFSRSNYPQSS